MQYAGEPIHLPNCTPRLSPASSGERLTKAGSTYNALAGLLMPSVAGGGEEDGNKRVYLIQLTALWMQAVRLNPGSLFPKLMLSSVLFVSHCIFLPNITYFLKSFPVRYYSIILYYFSYI